MICSFYLQLWNIFSASLQILLISSCSVNSCNSDVSMEVGELSIFLLYHLSYSPFSGDLGFDWNASLPFLPISIWPFCFLLSYL